jgi:hypothetical protein
VAPFENRNCRQLTGKSEVMQTAAVFARMPSGQDSPKTPELPTHSTAKRAACGVAGLRLRPRSGQRRQIIVSSECGPFLMY